MSTRVSNKALSIVLPVLLAACVSDGEGTPTGPNGEPPAEVERTVKISPSFSADIVEIFERRGCNIDGCHGTGTGAGTLLLTDTATAYAGLVDVLSGCNGIIRVIPGDADNSYLVMKVEGTHTCGGRMPPNDNPLDSIDQANIRNWVTEGAFNN
jgi:hypothetical protein